MTTEPVNLEFPEIFFIKVADLHIDFRYQRETSSARARKIANAFDARLFDPITVVSREGQWWVIDGGHRVMAAKMAGVELVPAVVSDSKSYVEDARLFSRKNAGQKKLTTFEQYRADLIAEIPDAVEVDKSLRANGWKLQQDISCIGALRRYYHNYGLQPVDRGLQVLRRAIPAGNRAESWLVGGVIVLAALHPELEDGHLAAVLTKRYAQIQRNVQILGHEGSASVGASAAKIIRDTYNLGLRLESRRLDATRNIPGLTYRYSSDYR